MPNGVDKRVVISKETTYNVLPLAGTGRELRRVTFESNLERANFQSNEITSTAQTSDMRLGSDNLGATLNTELSAGSYSDLMEGLFRGTFTAGVTFTGITVAGAAGKFVRSAGNWLTDGFKVGDRILVSGFTGVGLDNNTTWLVSDVTATDLSVVETATKTVAVVAEGDSVTVAVQGKKLSIPLTPAARTDTSFTVEEFYQSISEAYLSTGLKVGSMDVSVQPNAMATVNFGLTGSTKYPKATAGAYFTSPTAASDTASLSGSKGVLMVNGAKVATVTNLQFTADGGIERSEVIGERQVFEIALGRIGVTGTFSAYFQNKDLFQKYVNEEEVSLSFWFEGGAADEDIIFTMPRIKLGGVNNDDKEVGSIISTVPFTALLPKAEDTKVDRSTLVIQDTSLV